ncbi:MAG: hypothetical protein U1A23_04350, partial [Candidatus Sungbacteria bacterium]|nr:hypothetical protein [Candidatus Sungbacteria bacterium]
MASLFANFLFGIRKLIFSSIIVAAVFGMLAPLISVQAAPSCPLSSQSGRTIITFGGATLNPNVKLSPVPVTIPAGTYNITLVSYDNHVSETDTQPNEQWYIIAKNSQGSPVVVSDSIADLANGQDTLTHVVNTDFRVLSAIASVSAYHTIQNGSTDPNSVIPLCVAFDSQNKFPIVSTNEASAIAYNEATLNGRVDPVGALDTVKWFEWGTSVSLGLKTEATAQGTPPSSFSFRLTSLLPNTTYYFRAFAK